MLALTGDKEFNRYIRTLASKQGMLLNENGLWRWRDNNQGSSNGATGFWELVARETEEDILDQIGMEFVEPDKRNYAHVVRESRKRH